MAHSATSVYNDSVETRLAPVPLVGARSIVLAHNPFHRGSVKASLRRLRRAGVISAGISRPRRREHGRVGGTLHLYSELNRDSARLYRRGDATAAWKAAESAAELERRPETQRLVELLAGLISVPTLDDEELDWVSLKLLVENDQDLTLLIRQVATLALLSRDSIVLSYGASIGPIDTISGRVSSIRDDMAVIESEGGSSFSLPVWQLARLHLDTVGAAVNLEWEMTELAGAFISALPGVAIGGDRPTKTRFSPYAQFGPPEFSDEFLAHLRSRPKTRSVNRPPTPLPPPNR
jgi:hypothetical protein